MRRGVWAWAALIACVSLVGGLPSANAHLMPDGHATINVQGRTAYVVLSLPVSWLGAVDDDGDAHLNSAELQAHREAILRTVHSGVKVHNGGAARPLGDVLLSPSPAHDRVDGAGTHLLVMGSVALADASAPLRLELQLKGPRATLTITATRDPQRDGQTMQGPTGSALFFAPWWERVWRRVWREGWGQASGR